MSLTDTENVVLDVQFAPKDERILKYEDSRKN